MSELDKHLSCDAMGGPDGCCGCLEWKADGSVICNECGTEFDVKPKSTIKVVKFSVEDAYHILGNLDEVNMGRLNQVSGPAYSLFHKGELLGCGGIRTVGIGEAWLMLTEEAKKHKRDLLTHCRMMIDKMMRDEKIWRVWSESPEDKPKNKNFLKKMGFRKTEAFLRG